MFFSFHDGSTKYTLDKSKKGNKAYGLNIRDITHETLNVCDIKLPSFRQYGKTVLGRGKTIFLPDFENVQKY